MTVPATTMPNQPEPETLPPGGSWTHREVIDQERKRLGLDRPANGGRPDQPTALCLSGGGIRSAAFCLGVLQALARKSLLQQFHYLSTVSGGGYVGGWLTRCIAEHRGDVAEVERLVLRTDGATEPAEVRQLRRYVNFLTPHPGPASSDSWAAVTLWVRNTLINWTVFLPVMMALMAAPILYVTLVAGAARAVPDDAGLVWFGAGLLALAALSTAVFHSCVGLPSHNHQDPPRMEDQTLLGLSGRQVKWRIVVPAMIWSVLVPVAEAPWLHGLQPATPWEGLFLVQNLTGAPPPARLRWPVVLAADVQAVRPADPAPRPTEGAGLPDRLASPALWHAGLLPLAAFAACLLAYALSWRKLLGDDYVRYFASREKDYRSEHGKAFFYNLPAWMFSSALSAGLLYLGIRLAANASLLVVAVVGPVWVIVADVLRVTAYVAVRRNGLRSELDREWLARLSGIKLRTALALGALVVLATILPRAVLDGHKAAGNAVYGVVTFLSGNVGAWLGSSARTAFLPAAKDGAPARLPVARLLGTASLLIFLLATLMLVGRLDVLIVRAVSRLTVWIGLDTASAAAGLVSCLLLGLSALLVGYFLGALINLNLFSMHAVYRNRLVRAFLGSARKRANRHSDRFTSFDSEDDIRVADTFTGRSLRRLYPVINCALNRTSGRDTARAERKAEPFVITPFHCGSSFLDDGRGAPRSSRDAPGAYVNTCRFAGREKLSGPDDERRGISLGAAMALSGAAVSPNRGYNSSPLTAFVMTLFNLRLGAWLPNPARAGQSDEFSRRNGPRNSVPSMLKELTGQSNDKDDFVYLSDGGHFDNLGLYSMLQRQCRQILVVDAGRDQNYGYDTLGRALEHARIDLGVKVNFIGPLKVGAKELDSHGAHASITYGNGDLGELIYIKPWVPDDAPAELRAYGQTNASFPHDTTADQFFTERDFETYRHLGEHLAGTLIEDALDAGTLPPSGASWPRRLCERVRRPAAEPATPLDTLFVGAEVLSGAMPSQSAATPLLIAAKRALSDRSSPKARALKALLWADMGDLERSHRWLEQHIGHPFCDLVRAHLHRRRGEARLARYWYRRSGRCYSHLPIEEELETLARQLLVL